MALPGILQHLLNHMNTAAAHGLGTARKFSINGGASAAPVDFNGTNDVALVVTGLDVSKANAGILPVERGGTGNASGRALAWVTPRSFSLTGAVTGSASVDGSANVTIATAIASGGGVAMPQTAEGPGQFTIIASSMLADAKLPSGGTWMYWGFTTRSHELYGCIDRISIVSGIRPGGSIIWDRGSTNPGQAWCWRIA